MMSTKNKSTILILLSAIVSCSEKTHDTVNEAASLSIDEVKIQQNSFDKKVQLRVESEKFLKFFVHNLSTQALMSIEVQSEDGIDSLQHIFANGYLLPGTSRVVSRMDFSNQHGSDWIIKNLAFDIAKEKR
ncbi:MAG: hypothetical protein ACI92O_000529 [Colwellia sp.]|jgi:hypothetical protein